MAGRKYDKETDTGGGNTTPKNGFAKSGKAIEAQKKSAESRVKNARLRNALINEFGDEGALAMILADIVKTGKVRIGGNEEILDPRLYVDLLKECLSFVQAKPRAIAEKIDDSNDDDGKVPLNQQFIIKMPDNMVIEPVKPEDKEVDDE